MASGEAERGAVQSKATKLVGFTVQVRLRTRATATVSLRATAGSFVQAATEGHREATCCRGVRGQQPFAGLDEQRAQAAATVSMQSNGA